MPATSALPSRARDEDVEHRRYFETRDADARAVLVDAYRPLAMKLAGRYSRHPDDRDDLRQVALIGILKALDRFDPARGVKFTTYAWVTAAGELKRHRRDSEWSVHLPRALQERYLRVAAAMDELPAEVGREATTADVAGRIGEPEASVRECLDIRASYPMSLERCLAGGGDVAMPACDSPTDAIDDRDALERALVRLGPLEREVVVLHYLEGMSHAEVASRVGGSQMKVSRALARGLDRLRALLAPLAATG